MKKTKRLTLSALFSAVSTALLALASLTEIADLAISMLASAVLVLAIIELSEKWGFMIYAVTSTLSLILLPSKFIAAVYLVFTGLYPLIKRRFDRFPTAIAWLFKALYFNASLTSALLIARFVFAIDTYAGWMLVLYFATANLTFVLFDFTIKRLTLVYLVRYRKRFSKFFK